LREAGVDVPRSVVFVAADLERDDLRKALARAGHEHDRPSFFGWLGVTPYLTRDAVVATIDAVHRASPPQSHLVFDFMASPSSLNATARKALEGLMRRLAALREPWVSFFDPAEIERCTSGRGFVTEAILGPAHLHARYFQGRRDRLTVGLLGHIAHVRA
jgi:methyltransferase (TIGR00027 family)